MKKIINIISALALGLCLFSCGKKSCIHVDQNNDHLCDNCNLVLSMHIDNNKDHICDLCFINVGEHKDENADGKCEYCNQNIPSVQEIKITSFLNKIIVGDEIQLAATISCVGGASTDVFWKTDNDDIAVISSDGLLKAKKAGTVEVSATSIFDSSKTDTVSITIDNKNWDEQELAMMNAYFGEAFPFIDAEFIWSDVDYINSGKLTAESTKEGAAELAINTLMGMDCWTPGCNESVTEFAKILSVDSSKALNAKIYLKDNRISVIDLYLFDAIWPEKTIAEYLQNYTIEKILSPNDALCFDVISLDNGILITVEGGNPSSYLKILENNNYKIDDSLYEFSLINTGIGYYSIKSPFGTITIDIFDSFTEYSIMITLTISIDILNEINDFIGKDRDETIILPAECSDLTAYSYDEKIEVIVNGGNLSEYLDILKAAGYAIDYSKYDLYLKTFGYGYYCIESPKRMVTLEIFDYSSYFIIVITKSDIGWPDEYEKIMMDNFGEIIPYFEGMNIDLVIWDWLCGEIENETPLNDLFSFFEEEGWIGGFCNSKNSYYYDTYLLIKTSSVDPTKTLIISFYYVYLDDGERSLLFDISISDSRPEIDTEYNLDIFLLN